MGGDFCFLLYIYIYIYIYFCPVHHTLPPAHNHNNHNNSTPTTTRQQPPQQPQQHTMAALPWLAWEDPVGPEMADGHSSPPRVASEGGDRHLFFSHAWPWLATLPAAQKEAEVQEAQDDVMFVADRTRASRSTSLGQWRTELIQAVGPRRESARGTR